MSFRDVPYRILRMLSQLVERHGTAGADGWHISMTERKRNEGGVPVQGRERGVAAGIGEA